MENIEITKEQLVEQVKSLQKKINSLEKTLLAHSHIEDALKTSEDNLSAILEKNADGILIVDTKGIVLYVNHAAEKLFGRSKEEFYGYEFGFPVSTDNETDTLIIIKGDTLCEVELRIVQIKFQLQPAFQLSIRDITERKLAEKALKESEEKCRVIFDHANDGMFLVDLETTKFFMCNESCTQMLDYKQEEFLNLKIADIHHIEDLPYINEQLEMLSKGLSGIRGDVSFKRKNGDIFIADLSSTIIQIAGKNYALVIFRDITERNHMEQALRESEKEFRQLSESMPQIVWITRADGWNIYFNQQWVDYTGLSLEESYGHGWNIPFHPDDQQRAWNAWQNAVANKGIYSIESRLRQKDGTYHWWLVRGVPMLDENNKIIKWFGTCTDIEEFKQAQEEIQKSEKKIRSILENSADAIFFADDFGNYTYTNKAVTDMLGFTQEEMLSKTIVDMAPPNRISEYLEIFNRLKTEGKIFTELQLLKNDGTYISTDLNAAVMPDSMIYASCRDITERKRTETELIIAKNKAEESDQLKTAFLHNISHEIRTPMNGIIGFSRFLNDHDLLPEKRKQYTDIVIQSSEQLLSIITDIVSIASIDSGHDKIQESEINVNLICKLLHEQFSRSNTNQNVELHLQDILADHEAIVITDPTKLTQILNNLIGNSFKFTHQGFVHFGYTLKNNQLEFYIKDSGIGIPSDMHKEIFKRFRQVEITETRTYGGSGLGLSITKAYVEMLGGKIWLTSEIDKGSVFYFTLPYKKAKSADSPKKHSVTNLDLEFDFEKPICLLIAEDEDTNFMLLEEFFLNMKVTIIRAINGIEAVEKFKSNPQIDLVLMDLKMPKMDGYQATTQIKELKPDLPVIAQTAYSSESDKNKALACGCSDFISKPIERELLLSKIHEQLHKQK